MAVNGVLEGFLTVYGWQVYGSLFLLLVAVGAVIYPVARIVFDAAIHFGEARAVRPPAPVFADPAHDLCAGADPGADPNGAGQCRVPPRYTINAVRKPWRSRARSSNRCKAPITALARSVTRKPHSWRISPWRWPRALTP